MQRIGGKDCQIYARMREMRLILRSFVTNPKPRGRIIDQENSSKRLVFRHAVLYGPYSC